VLGLDIGSNSVGSAWADHDAQQVLVAASVFPAGVDEKDDKRGAPKNQARRQTRQQRRTIDRRARRKRLLQRFLIENHLLPRDADAFEALIGMDPWPLRVEALSRALSPHEFGRICLHMAQRRGASGINITIEDDDEAGGAGADGKQADSDDGKIKAGMKRLELAMKEAKKSTVAQFIVALAAKRSVTRDGVTWREPIRNRQYRMPEDQQYYAGRELIRDEFHKIVAAQRGFKKGPLAKVLTDELVSRFDNPKGNATWKNAGLLFGQRRIYWDMGTLGRCDLEPTERCAPIADRHAGYYRVVAMVNNILLLRDDRPPEPLSDLQRQAVIDLLRGPLFMTRNNQRVPKSSASVTEIKAALGIAKNDKSVRLNIDKDDKQAIVTDWFHREIVHGAIGVARWDAMDERARESVNRAILKFDPEDAEHAQKLRDGARSWWGLDGDACEALVAAWLRRPKLEKRLNLSRKAILNLLPFMEAFNPAADRWPTQQEARKEHAQTLDDEHARRRYETGAPGLTAADRYYMRQDKHRISDDLAALPPAPMLSNPVVRKAIHEVRRHVIAWMRRFGRRPDRVVIEMARETKDSERRRNEVLARNRWRNAIREKIIEEVLPMAFGQGKAAQLTLNQRRAAVDRVLLARQQDQTCPYCHRRGLTDVAAAKGDGVEIDHIAPYSRTGDNGLNNKVVVHTECNRGKTNKTPREWWGATFDEKIVVAERLFKDAKPDKGDYFRYRDYARKWDNFTREIAAEGEWRTSQLTDTAYAAKQVAAYLADALYDGRGLPERGDGGDQQRIFFTMGRFTSTLRKDWQLFETLLASESLGTVDTTPADERLAQAAKDRGDHRQHAIDAAVIALTDPAIKNVLASEAKRNAEYHDRHGKWPKRTPIGVPWGKIDAFRLDVLGQVYPHLAKGRARDGAAALVVSHRPVKRRLVGAFHEETHYGPVVGPLPSHRREKIGTLFTNRISAGRLTPNHLRVPDGWDALSAKLHDPKTPDGARCDLRRQLAALADCPPAKSGIVRDRALRDRIRKCLRGGGMNPDKFTANEINKFVAEGKLTMASGVPIKGVVLLRVNSDPVVIPRGRRDAVTGQRTRIVDPRDAGAAIQRTDRVYIGGNNHHLAIRADRKSGKWGGGIVPTYAAARRVRIEKRDAVDRSDTETATFVMSLAEGEMIYARRRDRPEQPPGFYVVCKLDKPATVHFAPHWDARKASEQDRWTASAAQLAGCGPESGAPPQKARVGPLGEVTFLEKD
jgi:CRISPR-associated endonuclease Csn1